MHTLGLVSVSFRKHTPTEIIQAMKAADLQVVEWGSDVHAPCDDIEKLDKIVALQKQYGITCSSYGTYFRMGTHQPEEIRQYIAAAKRLGTSILRIWCGCSCPDICRQCGKHNLVEEARALAAIAEDEGVVLCMECHNDTFTQDIDPILALLAAVDSPHFGMYWQPNQYRSFARNNDYARRIAPYVKAVHVFHWDGECRLPLHEAVHEWKEYISAIGGDVPLLLEFMPDDDIRTLPTEADALRDIARGEIR